MLRYVAGRRKYFYVGAATALPVRGGLSPHHLRERRAQQSSPGVRAGAGGHEGGEPRRDDAQRVHVVHEGYARRRSHQPLEGVWACGGVCGEMKRGVCDCFVSNSGIGECVVVAK